MKLVVLFLLATAGFGLAFQPPRMLKSSPHVTTSPVRRIMRQPARRNVPALFSMTGGGTSEPPLGDLMVIDVEEARTQIAENWGWILFAGAVNVAAGSWALYAPVSASTVAESALAFTLLGVGLTNAIGTFFIEKGYKVQSFLLGALQLGLGYLAFTNPLEGQQFLTLAILSSVFVDGLFRVVLAVQNRDLSGWFLTLLSGLISMVASVYVFAQSPALAALTIPGIALGCNLASVGFSRILIALEGRELAKEIE